MAITYVENWVTQAPGVSTGGVITSGSLSMAAGDVVVVFFTHENQANVGTPTIDLSAGAALTWTQAGATANTTNNCKTIAWYAIVGSSGNRTVRVTCGDNAAKSLHTIVHTGAHATTPVPAGNVFTGVGGADVTRSITPTASGSALWMGCADWNATTWAAGTSCTLAQFQLHSGAYSGGTIRPTTQPRTDANAFTLAESGTSEKIAWVALEVQAAADSGVSVALTGLSATGSAGSLAAASAKALTGAAATTAAGSVAAAAAPALTGMQATGAVGSATTARSLALTGLQATGSPGSVAATSGKALTGSAATASAGAVAASSSAALTGLQASGQIGTVDPSNAVSVALTGAAATAAAGTLQSAASSAVTGAGATASAGSVSAAAACALTGVSAATAAGSTAASSSAALTGAAATGATGTVAPPNLVNVALTGVLATGSAGSLAASQAIVLPGLAAAAGIGSVDTSNAISVALGGVSATAAAGSLGMIRSLLLSGVEALAAAGAFDIDRDYTRAPAGNGYTPRRRQPTLRPRR